MGYRPVFIYKGTTQIKYIVYYLIRDTVKSIRLSTYEGIFINYLMYKLKDSVGRL